MFFQNSQKMVPGGNRGFPQSRQGAKKIKYRQIYFTAFLLHDLEGNTLKQ